MSAQIVRYPDAPAASVTLSCGRQQAAVMGGTGWSESYTGAPSIPPNPICSGKDTKQRVHVDRREVKVRR